MSISCDPRAITVGPRDAELPTVRSTVAEKQRLLTKYQDDYEADRLDAELYSTRTRGLRSDLEKAEGRVAELVLELAEAETAPLPTDEDRAALHALLAERIHTGPVPVRKALFTALVERLEVHAVDDVRPTFRLGAAPDLSGLGGPDGLDGEETSTSDAEVADGADLFAYRRPGWS